MQPTLFLDDLRPGDVHQHGSHTLTRDEIVAFAANFDPQPFHLDEAAAERSAFGGLIASGWHTAAVVHRLLIDGFIGKVASMGSPGADEIRWLRPVRPGDTISLTTTLLEVTPSQKKSDRGSIRLRYEVVNQRGELVMTMTGLGIVGRRPTTGG